MPANVFAVRSGSRGGESLDVLLIALTLFLIPFVLSCLVSAATHEGRLSLAGLRDTIATAYPEP